MGNARTPEEFLQYAIDNMTFFDTEWRIVRTCYAIKQRVRQLGACLRINNNWIIYGWGQKNKKTMRTYLHGKKTEYIIEGISEAFEWLLGFYGENRNFPRVLVHWGGPEVSFFYTYRRNFKSEIPIHFIDMQNIWEKARAKGFLSHCINNGWIYENNIGSYKNTLSHAIRILLGRHQTHLAVDDAMNMTDLFLKMVEIAPDIIANVLHQEFESMLKFEDCVSDW